MHRSNSPVSSYLCDTQGYYRKNVAGAQTIGPAVEVCASAFLALSREDQVLCVNRINNRQRRSLCALANLLGAHDDVHRRDPKGRCELFQLCDLNLTLSAQDTHKRAYGHP
nr:MAG TPA: hypothetical protein [Caudoviricetes sp.]